MIPQDVRGLPRTRPAFWRLYIMNTDIRYIFLDLGGTFRVIDEDPAYLSAARAKIAELCGVETDDPNKWFDDVIDKRYD